MNSEEIKCEHDFTAPLLSGAIYCRHCQLSYPSVLHKQLAEQYETITHLTKRVEEQKQEHLIDIQKHQASIQAKIKEIQQLKQQLGESVQTFYSMDEIDSAAWARRLVEEEAKKNPQASDEITYKNIETANGFILTLWKNNRPVMTATAQRTAFNGTAVVLAKSELA